MPNNDQSHGLIADIREHVLYMQELGFDALDVRVSEKVPAADEPVRTAPVAPEFVRAERAAAPPDLQIPDRSLTKVGEKKSPGSRIAALPSLANRGPRTPMPVESPMLTAVAEASETREPSELMEQTIHVQSETLESVQSDTIESIRAEIGNCTRCPLHALGRTQIVHSTGNFNASLMFVGEAPGADEDEQGFPFVGRAGQLLTKIIESIGMSREEVFIGNINRCRPPGNRAPEPIETAACRPFLLREIAVIKPKVIVVLGATAAHNLLQVKTPISKLRGNFHDYFGVKVMPTFHPAYLLRDPHKKREVWEDMKKVRDLLTSA